MKKIFALFLCVMSFAVLCSCGKTQQPQTTAVTTSEAVQENLVSVEINGDFIGDVEKLKSQVEAFNGGEFITDDSGDVTIKMPEDSYKLFLESRKVPVMEALDKGYASLDFFKSYTVADDMRSIDVFVDTEIYTGDEKQNTFISVESSAIIAYQIFVNEPFGLTIHVIDSTSEEEITNFKAF